MPTGGKTYSFRASPELGERLKCARDTFAQVFATRPGVDELIVRDFHLSLLRQFTQARDQMHDQSALMRTAVELFVSATEKIAGDLALVSEYTAWEAEDREGDAFRVGALEAGASIWQDD
jgi:hypothetical protein